MSHPQPSTRAVRRDPFDRYLPLRDSHDDVAAVLAGLASTVVVGSPAPTDSDEAAPKSPGFHDRLYRVTLCVEQCWTIDVYADDPDAAEDKALNLWDEQAPVGFKEADILRIDAIGAEELS